MVSSAISLGSLDREADRRTAKPTRESQHLRQRKVLSAAQRSPSTVMPKRSQGPETA